MKAPFTYVLFIVRGLEHRVSLYQTLSEAEEALRDFTASIFCGGLADEELIEILAEDGIDVHVHAVTQKRNKQTSTELKPFARAKAA